MTSELSAISIVRIRLYLFGLIILVLSKNANNPVIDLIPSLAAFVKIVGWELSTAAQVYSLKLVAGIGLAIAFFRPINVLAVLVAIVSYSIFTMGLYSQVYSNQLRYIPHSENIHFFLLVCLLLNALIEIGISKAQLTGWMSALVGWTYLASVFTKLQNVGVTWATGETLPAYFLSFWLITGESLLKSIGESPTLMSIAGISTVIFELLALPLLVFPRTRNFTIAVCLLFHAAVWWLFGINFFMSYFIAFILIWTNREKR